jgi:hypothetical protein
MHLWLFINHTNVFRSLSAAIFMVYIMKEYKKKSVRDLSS